MGFELSDLKRDNVELRELVVAAQESREERCLLPALRGRASSDATTRWSRKSSLLGTKRNVKTPYYLSLGHWT